METMRIASVEGKRGPKMAYYVVELEDGRKLTTFDGKVSSLAGALVEFEVIKKGNFSNIEVKKVIAPGNRDSDVAILKNETNDKPSVGKEPKEPDVNPIFAYLGACTLAAPMVSGYMSSGMAKEEAVVAIKGEFDTYVELAADLLRNHLKFAEIVKTASSLMDN